MEGPSLKDRPRGDELLTIGQSYHIIQRARDYRDQLLLKVRTVVQSGISNRFE